MMGWLSENKDQLFSGIGVTVLLVFWYLSKELYKLSWKYCRSGYYIPNSLSYFSHSDLEDGTVIVKAKRIVSVHAVRNKTISIQYPINTAGKIKSTLSLSDPGTMQVVEPGQNTGKNSVSIMAKRNSQYIVASESERQVFPFKENTKPQKDNIVMHTLHTERLTKPQCDFVGARVIGKTQTQRIVVEFSKNFKPAFVKVIQINAKGEVIRDERSPDFISASHQEGTLFVYELHSPEEGSGIYLWWEWPEKQHTKNSKVYRGES